MTFWPSQLSGYPVENFGTVTPSEVLFEFNGPLLFVFEDKFGSPLLAHHCEPVEQEISRFVVVPTGSQIIQALRTGILSIREAFDQPLIWLIEAQILKGARGACIVPHLDDLPDDAMPDRWTMLYPSLDPLLRLRYLGAALQAGNVASNLLKRAVDSAEQALQSLANFLLGGQAQWSQGAVQFLQGLYNPSAQQLAFGSLEIAFRVPRPTHPGLPLAGNLKNAEEALAELRSVMADGWAWTNLNSWQSSLGIDQRAEFAVLAAIKALSPTPQAGQIRIEVSGQIVPNEPFVILNSAVRRLAHKRIRSLQSTKIQFSHSGVIEEMDKGKKTFTLRWPSGEQRCRFQKSLLPPAVAAFLSGMPVTVTGFHQAGSPLVDAQTIT